MFWCHIGRSISHGWWRCELVSFGKFISRGGQRNAAMSRYSLQNTSIVYIHVILCFNQTILSIWDQTNQLCQLWQIFHEQEDKNFSTRCIHLPNVVERLWGEAADGEIIFVCRLVSLMSVGGSRSMSIGLCILNLVHVVSFVYVWILNPN